MANNFNKYLSTIYKVCPHTIPLSHLETDSEVVITVILYSSSGLFYRVGIKDVELIQRPTWNKGRIHKITTKTI